MFTSGYVNTETILHFFNITRILLSNLIAYCCIIICTISVHCSTVEVQSVFLLISSSSLVYFTDCNCSMTGANETSCHPETGQCSCRENVIGQHCEQCEINYYNFNSGAGCSSCDCNPTYSTSLQCDGNTGVCSCKPGINGAKCTGCADQFYNLTDQGNVYDTYR